MKTIIGMPSDLHEPFELPRATAHDTGVRHKRTNQGTPVYIPLTVSRRRKLDACRLNLPKPQPKAMRQSTAQCIAFGLVCFVTAAIVWCL
jgi:hypothetical protein